MERRSEVLGRKVFKDLFVSASRFSKGETHTQSFSGSLSFHTGCSIFLKDSSEETPKGRKGTAGRPFGGFFFFVCLLFQNKFSLPKSQSSGNFPPGFQRERRMNATPSCSDLLPRNTTQPQISSLLLGLTSTFLSLKDSTQDI